MNFCELGLLATVCPSPLKSRFGGLSRLASSAEVLDRAGSLRGQVPDDVDEAQIKQPCRPAYQDRRRMRGLGALEKIAHRLEHAARVGAGLQLPGRAVAAALGLAAGRRRAVRRLEAERVAEQRLRAPEQLFGERKLR